jgi:hypothetical protein
VNPTVAAVAIFVLAAGSAASQAMDLTSQASGSAYFTLSRPYASKTHDGFRLAGRVCRRSHTTVLSPPRVRLEHLGPGGAVSETGMARIGAIYRPSDQACSSYAKEVRWTMASGDMVRACFDRGRACPADAPEKAIAVRPASGATSNR